MNTYFALFVIATITSLVLTPLIRRLSERWKFLDVPLDGRRVHSKAVPRLGGVAVYLSVVLALSALPFVDNLLTQSLRGHSAELLVTFLPASLVLLLGIYDDLHGTNATVKFFGLGLIAVLFYTMGGRITDVAIPFAGSFHLPPMLSLLVTVIWLVGIANAFNLIDGIDGLASGAALFSSLVILIVSLSQDNPLTIVVTLVLCGALVGFLRYNFNPASIFLGDSGALFVGFTLAALSVLGTQKATTAVAVITPILAFAFPMVDTTVTMLRRAISRRPLFQGDNEHIHHMLLARGWSQKEVVLALYTVCAGFGLLAAISAKTSSPLTGLVLFVIAVAVIVAVGHLRYHEMDEIRAGVKRTVGDRRLRIANNIRIRRASLALSKASDLRDLLEAVREMLEFDQFAYANLSLGRIGEADINEHALKATANGHSTETLGLRNGRIDWVWRGNGLLEDVGAAKDFWSFRLPLTTENDDWGLIDLFKAFDSDPLLIDMNYLSGPFRRELAEAVERILTTVRQRRPTTELRLTAGAGRFTS